MEREQNMFHEVFTRFFIQNAGESYCKLLNFLPKGESFAHLFQEYILGNYYLVTYFEN